MGKKWKYVIIYIIYGLIFYLSQYPNKTLDANIYCLMDYTIVPSSVKESLSLYADTIYEGQPMDFKVWIINKSQKSLKVIAFFSDINDLFLFLPVTIWIKDEKNNIRQIKHGFIDFIKVPYFEILPNDSLYYKFSKCVSLAPGRYEIKLKKGLTPGIKNDWISICVKESYKYEKELAFPVIYFHYNRDKGENAALYVNLYEKILFKKSNEIGRQPAASDKVIKETSAYFYKKLKKKNRNSPYLPYILLNIINSLIRNMDGVNYGDPITYEEFINSEYLKEFKKWKNFPYYEDIPLWEAMVLFKRAVRNRDISLYNLGMQKLEKAENKMPKYLYIKLWKDFAQKVVKKIVEGRK